MVVKQSDDPNLDNCDDKRDGITTVAFVPEGYNANSNNMSPSSPHLNPLATTYTVHNNKHFVSPSKMEDCVITTLQDDILIPPKSTSSPTDLNILDKDANDFDLWSPSHDNPSTPNLSVKSDLVDFGCWSPFHDNPSTPNLSVKSDEGEFGCWSPFHDNPSTPNLSIRSDIEGRDLFSLNPHAKPFIPCSFSTEALSIDGDSPQSILQTLRLNKRYAINDPSEHDNATDRWPGPNWIQWAPKMKIMRK